MMLPAAPENLLTAEGRPRFGRYAGQVDAFDWHELAPPHARGAWWRRFHHKRWHYVALATPELFCGVAIVDVGWTNTAFAYIFDRRERRIVAEFSQDGVPGLTASLAGNAGGASRFRFLSRRIGIECVGQRLYRLKVEGPGLRIAAEFGPDLMPLLLACGPAAGGSAHATQKSTGLPLWGEAAYGAVRHSLDGGVASFDYSNGLLARETAWRWASAHSLDLGFNLQAGYFGAQENALWLDGQLYGLGAAHFDFQPAAPLAPWHIHTDDGLLDLHFKPEGARAKDKNLLVAASRYVQPIGTFSGWVRASADAPKRIVAQLAGVTEDHRSRW
ncbi:DUF2804 domain-containing protein [Janthinobacterium fluminis]|uniref:DUF2804 domain-containing protein n=1 Tax=Janthinobacterium fluminis TaxID=2987524 RepID=A0ABT5K0G1_9BURK|nr:DUF2804 domain-containing protein [Janthinobacterium fluminis]MDC8758476.1 DUF2804 domain-containing protein [Janthinobacterium fluminis]